VSTTPPPAPPWHSRVDAVLWWHRTPPASSALLPAELGRPAPVALGGLIAYREGPVGPYGEVFAAVGVRRGARLAGHVPFMAVDSLPSVAGGRANWALPKELAAFDGDPGTPGRVRARGEGWALEVVARARPRAVPAWAAVPCVQAWPDGRARTFPVTIRGRARAGSVEVRPAAGSPLPAGLRPGRHPAVFLSGRQAVGLPRP
jgi:hypothetical protein